MTTITLPPDIEEPLIEQAHEQGTTPEPLALDSLRMLFAPQATSETGMGETLYDLLSGYVSTVSGTTEALSTDSAQHFAEGMAEKQRQGHLYVQALWLKQ